MEMLLWASMFYLAVAAIPQALRTMRLGFNTLSPYTWVLWTFGEFGGMAYGLDQGSSVMALMYTPNLIALLIILFYSIFPRTTTNVE